MDQKDSELQEQLAQLDDDWVISWAPVLTLATVVFIIGAAAVIAG